MELFQQAATIMVLGMGLVFVFLAVVIAFVHITARMVRRYEAGLQERDTVDREGGGGDGLIAAVAVVIHEQRAGAQTER